MIFHVGGGGLSNELILYLTRLAKKAEIQLFSVFPKVENVWYLRQCCDDVTQMAGQNERSQCRLLDQPQQRLNTSQQPPLLQLRRTNSSNT